jgi:hypothetical protein
LWSIEGLNLSGGVKARRADGILKTKQYYDDPLDWCLSQMLGDVEDKRRFSHAMLFAFFEHYMSKESKQERARIDEELMRNLSDFVALHEILQQLRLYRPRAMRVKYSEYADNEPLENGKSWRYCISRQAHTSQVAGKRRSLKPPEGWSILEDIPSWLRSMRLDNYTNNLKDLHWTELVDLDDKELEDRGVKALSSRKRLLKAFQKVQGMFTAKPSLYRFDSNETNRGRAYAIP